MDQVLPGYISIKSKSKNPEIQLWVNPTYRITELYRWDPEKGTIFSKTNADPGLVLFTLHHVVYD